MSRKHPLRWLPFARFRNPPPIVAVVRLSGVIGQMGPLRRGLSLSTLGQILERAFSMKGADAVALAVNSPGGSPVQSALIAKRIRALAEENKLPVFTFAEDVAASGGYWLLSAGDEIYADESSVIGSIGVISASFGFPEALNRLGIERRVYTAGEHKGSMDPFRPENEDDIAHLKVLQADIHDAFCQQIRDRRGDKLKDEAGDLFSGRYWTGRKALDLGLVDGLGDLRSVMRERFGETVKLRLVAGSKPWWKRRAAGTDAGLSVPLASDLASDLISAVEERLIWSRFGL
jgi:signal peptide peptidase SppA